MNLNRKSGKKLERKICENQIETCAAGAYCPGNTDDTDEPDTNDDGGAPLDDGKCWIEYPGKEVRWVHSPPFNKVSAFKLPQEPRDYCQEMV